MSRKNASAICILVAAIWGGGFIATDAALATFDPFTVLLIRFLGASLVCWLIVGIQKIRITKAGVLKGSLSGIFLYLAFAFQTFGLDMTNTGQNAFLTAVNVVMVPYIAWLIFKKRPQFMQVFASLICLIGIGCLSLSKGQFHFSFGDGLSLMCAFFFACHFISLEYSTKGQDVRLINAVQMSVAAIVSIPGALCLETVPSHISLMAVFSCLYMILIATWLAFQLQTLAQKYIDSSSASVLLCTESLFANVFGFVLLHEEKTWIMILGGLLIFLSVILVEGESLFDKNRIFKRLSKE
ncbi:EamA-like transporter family [Faecalicoccus pleomorphus]|uniref:EamA-like transporter family n=1 Tax=Faecalicoccus pleomorphus TaxID=1323 RepID=A0A380LIS8_9FIRM|nr:DMT family transporter [Faecalicoccus pleomorphus]SUO03748.1 EamA-like transporter family [Faecalicoccus pleomorphus]